MSSIDKSGTFTLGTRTVKRFGYGAMQLAGPAFWSAKDKMRRWQCCVKRWRWV